MKLVKNYTLSTKIIHRKYLAVQKNNNYGSYNFSIWQTESKDAAVLLPTPKSPYLVFT